MWLYPFILVLFSHLQHQRQIQISGPVMHPILVLLLVVYVTPSPVPSIVLPIQQRGLPDLGKTVDVESLMMMMNDEEEGSGFQEIFHVEHKSCPFGCQCNLYIVQCSDLGEWISISCLCTCLTASLYPALHLPPSFFVANYIVSKVQHTHANRRPQNST